MILYRHTYQGVADEARRTAASTLAAFLAQADKTVRDNAIRREQEPDERKDGETGTEPRVDEDR